MAGAAAASTSIELTTSFAPVVLAELVVLAVSEEWAELVVSEVSEVSEELVVLVV